MLTLRSLKALSGNNARTGVGALEMPCSFKMIVPLFEHHSERSSLKWVHFVIYIKWTPGVCIKFGRIPKGGSATSNLRREDTHTWI